ncbi:hypothetical protein [Leucobacter chinensis]|uniref:hypothetical protein n=1 Tax=Leucobacter chinensis TaxID=2851010 RepID=UPI001C22501B|nr:hypothetical protein [Leucobacter chinensis]
MTRTKPLLVALAVLVAGVLAWWIFVKPSQQPLASETFAPHETEAAFEAAGFTPIEPRFTPEGYELATVTVNEITRSGNGTGPKEISYLYERGSDTYLLAVSATTMSLEDLIEVNPVPHSTLQRLDLRGREVVLQTEEQPEGANADAADQLEELALYRYPGGYTYRIDAFSGPGRQLGPDAILEVLASLD